MVTNMESAISSKRGKDYPFDSLFSKQSSDPHRILGLHPEKQGYSIRILRPGAEELWIEVRGKKVSCQKMDSRGLFVVYLEDKIDLLDYQIYHTSGLLANDPYAFWPTLGDVDLYLFGNGTHYRLFDALGAKEMVHQGVQGVRFTLWAPSAKSVALVGDFNHWDGRVNPMRALGSSGIWEIFVPGLVKGQKYKFEVTSQTGDMRLKTDPFGRYFEVRPKNASIIDTSDFIWHDQDWLEKRKSADWQKAPINIYEVHIGSWKRKNGHEFLNYRELAVDLGQYLKEMNYTHVEFMPVQEHPFDPSWGYQVTGFFAPTSRFGTPDDFRWLVDHLHSLGIGVILDWVPGHFPKDDFSLARFDGTALYEHEDPRQGEHPHWSTNIFNFGRREVSNFLIANALFWLEEMHVDGLRVDAVASMLYLDYGRKSGEWIPNQWGGKENIEAIEFLRHLHSIIHQKVQGALVIAEESTSFGGVSHPVTSGGLGFDMKWNMGWMNDTLRYFSKDSLFRKWHQGELTFGLLYAFTEKFILVLSHDEVVHGKRSLLDKMPGDLWQKFANLRLLLSYMTCQPGKKLLFMGGEIGQWNEWDCRHSLDWHLLDYPLHRGVQQMVRTLNGIYRERSELHERDFDYTGFEWIDFSDEQNCVLSYLRKSSRGSLLCVHHFSPQYFPEYYLHMKHVKSLREIFNSDAEEFGGSGKGYRASKVAYDAKGTPVGVILTLAPLATAIYEVEWI